MSEVDEKITELQTRLENLVRTQIGFQQEITQIRYELNVLRAAEERSVKNEYYAEPRPPEEKQDIPPVSESETASETTTPPPIFDYGNGRQQPSAPAFTGEGRTQLEKFIGE